MDSNLEKIFQVHRILPGFLYLEIETQPSIGSYFGVNIDTKKSPTLSCEGHSQIKLLDECTMKHF